MEPSRWEVGGEWERQREVLGKPSALFLLFSSEDSQKPSRVSLLPLFAVGDANKFAIGMSFPVSGVSVTVCCHLGAKVSGLGNS